MIQIKLREAIEDYRRRTGQEITYERLAQVTGLSRATVESIASRRDYNASIQTIGKLCEALGCAPGDLLAMEGIAGEDQ